MRKRILLLTLWLMLVMVGSIVDESYSLAPVTKSNLPIPTKASPQTLQQDASVKSGIAYRTGTCGKADGISSRGSAITINSGDLVIIHIALATTTGGKVSSFTLGAGNNAKLLDGPRDNSVRSYLYYYAATSNLGSVTPTLTLTSSTRHAWTLAVYTGCATSSPYYEGVNYATGSGASPQTGSVTIAAGTANRWVVSAAAMRDSATGVYTVTIAPAGSPAETERQEADLHGYASGRAVSSQLEDYDSGASARTNSATGTDAGRTIQWVQHGVAILPAAGVTTTRTITTTVTETLTTTATMTDRYQLTIGLSPAEGGSTAPLPGGYLYDSGSSVTVSEEPATGFAFDHWDLDGSNVGSNPNYTVVMGAPHTLTALFQQIASRNSTRGSLVGVCASAAANEWVNYGDWLTDERMEMIKQTGCNIVVLMMSSWAWDNNPVSPVTSLTHRDTMIRIVNSLKSKGLMVIIQAHCNTQKINDFSDEAKGELIMDSPLGSQDSWIASWSDVIRTLKPDGIVIINEPPGIWGTAYKDLMTMEEFSRHYWDFATRMCETYNAIDPNIRLHVMSCPYWRMDYIVNVNSPINVPNVVYEWHFYPFFNKDPALDQLYAEGKVTEAAAYIEDFLLSTGTTLGGKEKRGLKTLMDRKLPLFCGEMGIDVYTCVNDPDHWKDRISALYAFMAKYDLDYVQYDLYRNPWSTAPDQIRRCGMLNAAGTDYNEIGKLWLQNMQHHLARSAA